MQIASNSIRRARPLLGTFVEVMVAGASTSAMSSAVEAAFEAVAKIQSLMSFHEAGSDVYRLNDQAWAKPLAVHPWTFQVLQAAIDLHRRSAGAFDIAVAPVLQDMGLLPRPANYLPGVRKTATTKAIELIPPHRVRFGHRSVKIDLGGIAKGFAVDRAIDALRYHDMPRGLVNAGGDLAVFGKDFEPVYIRNPRDPHRVLCRVRLKEGALASSGNYFDALRCPQPIGSAIIVPGNGKQVRSIVGATVYAPSCMLADALTKVVMIAGPCAAGLLKHYHAGALAVARDGTVWMTRDFESATCLAA